MKYQYQFIQHEIRLGSDVLQLSILVLVILLNFYS